MGERLTYSSLVALDPDDLRRRLASSPLEAARLVRAAALGGHPTAMVQFGRMLLDGAGVAPDPAAALRWFSIAAEAGYPDAINMVGRCHELGWGTPVDPAQAALHYRRAAATGHAWARFNLGCLMLRGAGVAQDAHAALPLFAAAARAGNAKAMNMLGRYREEGWAGVAIALPKAERWYRRAAVRGCFRGQFHCGRLALARGDIGTAVPWFRRSWGGAPEDFRRDLAALLRSHDHPDIRAVVTDAQAG